MDAHWQGALTYIERGDADGVVEYLMGLSEAQRVRLGALALKEHRRAAREHGERARMEFHATGRIQLGSSVMTAAAAAALACATFEQLQARHCAPPPSLSVEILTRRRPAWIQEWLEHAHAGSWNRGISWTLLDGLVGAGLAQITPELSIAIPATLRDNAPKDVPLEDLIAQRDWLCEAIWLLFEIEGEGSSSLATCDKYSPVNSPRKFSAVFARCAERGILDRQRLLDASLDALTRGFSPSRSSWFSRFHEQLAPTRAERATRAPRYFALLASDNGATVSFALNAANALLTTAALPAEQIAHAIRSAPEPTAAGTRKRAHALLRRAEKNLDAANARQIAHSPPSDAR